MKFCRRLSGPFLLVCLFFSVFLFAQESDNLVWKIDNDSFLAGGAVASDYLKTVTGTVEKRLTENPIVCQRVVSLKLMVGAKFSTIEVTITDPLDRLDGGKVFKIACPSKAPTTKEEKEFYDFQVRNSAENILNKARLGCD